MSFGKFINNLFKLNQVIGFAGAIVVLLLLTPRIGIVIAATPGISISPGVETTNVKLGETYTSEITITNNTPTTVVFKPNLAEYTVDQSGQKILETNPAANKYSWVSFDNKNIVVASGKSSKLKVTYKPAGINPGVFFPIIFFTPISEAGSNVTINQQIGSVNRINVIGTDQPSTKKVIINKLESNILAWGEDITASYEIKNISNFLTSPIVYIQIVGPNNKILYREVIENSKTELMPMESYSGVISLPGEKLENSVLPSSLKVELLVIDQQFNSTDNKSVNVWFINQYLLVVVGGFMAIAAVLIAVGYMITQTYKARSKRLSKLNKPNTPVV